MESNVIEELGKGGPQQLLNLIKQAKIEAPGNDLVDAKLQVSFDTNTYALVMDFTVKPKDLNESITYLISAFTSPDESTYYSGAIYFVEIDTPRPKGSGFGGIIVDAHWTIADKGKRIIANLAGYVTSNRSKSKLFLFQVLKRINE